MMMLGMFLFLMFGFQEAPSLDFFFFFFKVAIIYGVYSCAA